MMSRRERRQLRRIERGVYATDPHWAKLIAGGCPSRYERKRRSLNMTLDVLAVVLMVFGVMAGALLVILAGVVVGACGVSLHVSRRRRAGRPRWAG